MKKGISNKNVPNTLGKIVYQDGKVGTITVPDRIGNTYNVTITNQQPIPGMHIPSHRPIYKYQNVPNISTQSISRKSAFSNYRQAKFQRYQGTNSPKSETYFIKETLISLATLGYGNIHVAQNEEYINLFEGFQKVLKQILPPKIGFEKISIRIPEVILETKSGEFVLDAVSGGIASIIDLAWQIYMLKIREVHFVLHLMNQKIIYIPRCRKRYSRIF